MFEHLSPALLARLDAAALSAFETRESYLAQHLNSTLPGRRTRNRDRAKAPASELLRPLDRQSMRAQRLAYLLPGASVTEAMDHLAMTRPAIFAMLYRLHHEHGIGFRFDAGSDTIAIRLPCPESDLYVNAGDGLSKVAESESDFG